jgi:hypothetical protein
MKDRKRFLDLAVFHANMISLFPKHTPVQKLLQFEQNILVVRSDKLEAFVAKRVSRMSRSARASDAERPTRLADNARPP